jgi:hypothetical protein
MWWRWGEKRTAKTEVSNVNKQDKRLNVEIILGINTTYLLGCLSKSSLLQSAQSAGDALSFNPEGRGFDSRWGHWDFSVI